MDETQRASARAEGGATIRPLESHEDFQQCVDLQHEIWGDDFGESAPPSILMVTQKVGGVAAGAFDSDGKLLGFVFGISGVRGGRLAHWSDMLGVREEARDLGLGTRLKAYQRDQLLDTGIRVAYWTYDPLEARNAHVNINRLGALPVEYVPDMYGEIVRSSLLSGLSTDRFVVEWDLEHPRVAAAIAGTAPQLAAAASAAPIVNTVWEGGAPVPRNIELVDVAAVRVEIPREIHVAKRTSMELARAWRSATRRAIIHYMSRGHKVTGFRADPESGRCFYFLGKS
jgi:predicted GNAT superfamily acetyltransferase